MARGGKHGGRVTKSEVNLTLAGNPNVGKSTLFNTLTGMRVHTGNWAGKTVDTATATVKVGDVCYHITDIPGTYSLFYHSEEERVARDCIAFGKGDITVVVCDATSLCQGLNLALQVMECGGRTAIALNLVDEAKKRGISVDAIALSREVGVAVFPTVAHKRNTITPLLAALEGLKPSERVLYYPDAIESAVDKVYRALLPYGVEVARRRYFALRLIDGGEDMREKVFSALGVTGEGACQIISAVDAAWQGLFAAGIDREEYERLIATALVQRADEIAEHTVKICEGGRDVTGRLDKILTGRVSAYPVMLLLLALTLFITLSLANYPSAWLASLFAWLEGASRTALVGIGSPDWLVGILIDGVLNTLGEVVAVMLPPMAIFFPLFSLLEDSGYLPRIAYNLDRPFACAGECGKQALTMCMGLGCNAVGIVGCRIIDSERERRLAILTNSLMPCNGRLPMLITLIGAFYTLSGVGGGTPLVALGLSLFIVLSVSLTFLITLLLSRTLLRGAPSSFTLELPPYRKPRVLSTVYRALTQKCASVLLRAVAVAAPFGALLWCLSSITVGGKSIISYAASALDPIGSIFGMDGAILLAFTLGIPANEIVIPILLLIYGAGGTDTAGALLSCGWTPVTALCTAIFALLHWPCSTSLITVYKETHSIRDTALAFLIPTVTGLLLCLLVNAAAMLFF